MRGFHSFDEYISHQGGVMSRSELLDAGWSADEVRLGVRYGTLHRLCRGWYGARDLPAAVTSAWAHGGPLACVSALHFLDIIDANAAALEQPHVCRPARAHRLRYATMATIHWSDEAYRSGTRWSVAPETALQQAARCAPDALPDSEQSRRPRSRWLDGLE
ncbi:hypothetical protein [Microcella sp.]|uniref:hypothetical protein n=1 Tax=Microcella sp. TaxID=1913979 RepID=UPI00391D77AA